MNLFSKNILSSLCLALAVACVQAATPTISCEVVGGNLIVTYTGTLYQSTDAVNWTAVPNAASPYQVKMGNKQLFFCSGGEVQPIVPGENFSTLLPGGAWLDMNWIKPGTFFMGSPTDELGRFDSEFLHVVRLTQGYWMGKFEVTQAQYEAVMGTNPSKWKGGDLPVETVSWNDAMAFCAKLTEQEKAAGRLPQGYEYTLPTEAQWEYACRAGTATALNNGKNLSDKYECPEMDEVGWYDGNAAHKTHPVGQKKPNARGLYDMHGNVAEWCSDWYKEDYYLISPETDPTGPETGDYRVNRGGSWYTYATSCRSANRSNGSSTGTHNFTGFRVALTPTKNMTIPLTEDVDLDMIWIAPGTFIMGSPEDELGRYSSNETQHQVTLTKGYWLGKYEVTQAQYRAVMKTNPSEFIGADLPVDTVSWFDAMEFCAKLTASEKAAGRLPEGYEYTLPTAAQWEYACRAGTTTALNSGKNLSDVNQCPEVDEVGWYDYNNNDTTHPVGQKQLNAWGLYDMHGNVDEWCLDWDGAYPTTAVIDPTGPETGSWRVLRGGSWFSFACWCRSAFWDSSPPNTAIKYVGFRVALAPTKNITIPLTENVDLDMIWIEPGTFIMGSPTDELGRFNDETQHEVTLTQGYWLGKYEVTQAQYRAVMKTNPSEFIGADLPVDTVSWFDAMEFCAKLTASEKAAGRLPEGYEYTLPTEAQWEYACRAGTTTALNSGKNLSDAKECPEMDEVGWYVGNSDETTHPAGQKQANAWGLYDMHGNVWEWCSDWKGDYPTSAVTDPTGPGTGSYRVVRGGSWYNIASSCRSAFRVSEAPSSSNSLCGFRVALAPSKIIIPLTPGENGTVPLSDTVSLDLNWIEPGTFIMGSPSDELGRYNEEFQHEVILTQGYWLGKYEVTQAQYETVMGTNPSGFKGADLPVEQVNWNDAMAFCSKLTEIEKAAGRLPEGYEYTLPTEAQWEYACRAGTTTALNSGKNLSDKIKCPEVDEVGWYAYNSGYYDSDGVWTGKGKTYPVGQKKPNAWGLYDMHGNVFEWCLDWYGYYPATAVSDPTGADTGSYRVDRGGAWYAGAVYCRSAHRSFYEPDGSFHALGFRVALAPVK